MKTIAYSLASTKCMEEGWTVRPPSPTQNDQEHMQDPFVIEVNPVQLVRLHACHMKLKKLSHYRRISDAVIVYILPH